MIVSTLQYEQAKRVVAAYESQTKEEVALIDRITPQNQEQDHYAGNDFFEYEDNEAGTIH